MGPRRRGRPPLSRPLRVLLRRIRPFQLSRQRTPLHLRRARVRGEDGAPLPRQAPGRGGHLRRAVRPVPRLACRRTPGASAHPRRADPRDPAQVPLPPGLRPYRPGSQPALRAPAPRLRAAGRSADALSLLREARQGGLLGARAARREFRPALPAHPLRAPRGRHHRTPGKALRRRDAQALRVRRGSLQHGVRGGDPREPGDRQRLRPRRARHHAGHGRLRDVSGHRPVPAIPVSIFTGSARSAAHRRARREAGRGAGFPPRNVQHRDAHRSGIGRDPRDRDQPARGRAVLRPLRARGRLQPLRGVARPRVRCRAAHPPRRGPPAPRGELRAARPGRRRPFALALGAARSPRSRRRIRTRT